MCYTLELIPFVSFWYIMMRVESENAVTCKLFTVSERLLSRR